MSFDADVFIKRLRAIDAASPVVKITGEVWITDKTEKTNKINVRTGRYVDRLHLTLECGHLIQKSCNSPKIRTRCKQCGEDAVDDAV